MPKQVDPQDPEVRQLPSEGLSGAVILDKLHYKVSNPIIACVNYKRVMYFPSAVSAIRHAQYDTTLQANRLTQEIRPVPLWDKL